VDGEKYRFSALLTSPWSKPTFLPGHMLLRHRNPTSRFHCEPYNITPVPPWGRIRTWKADDVDQARMVQEVLNRKQQVGIPSGFLSDQLLDVRIVTKEHAQGHWGRIQGLKTSWMVSKSDHLLCCWQDDSEKDVSNEHFIGMLRDLLRTKERLMSST